MENELSEKEMAEATERGDRYLSATPSDNAFKIDLLLELSKNMSKHLQSLLFNSACMLQVLKLKGIITKEEMDQVGNELRASQALSEALLEIQDAENRLREAEEGTGEEQKKEE